MKLSPAEITDRLGQLPNWTLDGNAITREFKFADFKSAFAFMTRVAPVADRLNHHPEWTNIYNRVSVRLTTHDVGSLSELDFELAKNMDQLASS